MDVHTPYENRLLIHTLAEGHHCGGPTKFFHNTTNLLKILATTLTPPTDLEHLRRAALITTLQQLPLRRPSDSARPTQAEPPTPPPGTTLRAILNPLHRADPLPHSADFTRAAFSNHRPDISVALDETLDDIPHPSPFPCTELVAEDVVAQRHHADIRLRIRDVVVGVERRLVGQLVERDAGELLCALRGRAARRQGVSTVDGGQRQQDQRYKFWKMLSSRCDQGSADGAGEGDACEGAGAKEARGT